MTHPMTETAPPRIAACLLAAYAARDISLDHIITELDVTPEEAFKIHEALLSAHMHLEWPNGDRTGRTSRVIAVVASPLLIPIIATLWLTWRLDRAIRTLRGRPL